MGSGNQPNFNLVFTAKDGREYVKGPNVGMWDADKGPKARGSIKGEYLEKLIDFLKDFERDSVSVALFENDGKGSSRGGRGGRDRDEDRRSDRDRDEREERSSRRDRDEDEDRGSRRSRDDDDDGDEFGKDRERGSSRRESSERSSSRKSAPKKTTKKGRK